MALAILAAGASRVAAQDSWVYQENPEWTQFVPRLRYLDFDIEGERDIYRAPGAGGNFENDRLYLLPRAGISWDNYIYHPNLLTYSLLFEPGYLWENSGRSDRMYISDRLMLNGHFTVNLLQAKPYSTSVFYNRSHEEQKYDFFNSATVDSEGWGGTTGYRDGPVPMTLTFQQSHEDSDGLNQTAITDQTTLNFQAKNQRAREDETDLNYQYGEFDRETDVYTSSYKSENIYHHAMLSDSEHFTKSLLRTTILFDDIESDLTSSKNLNAAINYSYEHTPNLHSFYNYSFSYFDGYQSDSMQHFATAGIQHQLYESLSSSADLHGSTLSSDSSGATFDSYTGGVSGSENYSKRIGAFAHLSLSESASYDVTFQNTGGQSLLIANESHSVPATGLVRLNSPRDTAIVSVTDSTGSITFLPDIDYTVIKTTEPWQIQLTPTGESKLPADKTILVTYTVQPNPSGDYSQFTDSAQIRMDFWNMFGVYARYNFTQNHASASDFVLEDVDEFQVGGDFNWRGVQLSANYTDRHSSLYDYQSVTLTEGYSRQVFTHSTIGINFNQQWSYYPAGSGSSATQSQDMTFYNYMVHYDWHPFVGFNWSAEAGFQQQRGVGLDQDLFAARTYLNWFIGKLEIHVGYEYENQDFTGQTRERNFAFLRLRRNF
ncbi:MAG TPA: hypothetical protein VFV23_00365 [Verrucomicrobiae bacterium]|nr:hypothetical protein [Verrucomicrobiae bacterium]